MTRIFVILGQGGTLFSGGLVELARSLKGLPHTIVTVHAWDDVQKVHDSIKHMSPDSCIVLVGKSLGANSCTLIAKAVAPRTVDLLVSYDASRFWGTKVAQIGENVKLTLAYWNPYAWPFGGQRITGVNIREYQVSNFHLTIDSDERLNAITLAAVKDLAK